MPGIVAVNMKKIKASASVNRLLDENYRTEETAEKYDDGHRIIRTADTVQNEFLLKRPENYDQTRRERVKAVNDAIAFRQSIKSVGGDKRRYQKLRHDAVDTLGIVVQPTPEWINSMSRDEQIRFFNDALRVMQDDPDYFGQIDTAVIHFDENSPHMQCLASTINIQTLKSDAKKILGNKSRMSHRQTVLAEKLKEKGWDVERGLQRIDNPAYQNWRDEKEREGLKVNRHNDMILLQRDLDLTAREQAVTSERAALLVEQNTLKKKQAKWDAGKADRDAWADKLADLEQREAGLEASQRALKAAQGVLDNERAEWDAGAANRAVSAAERDAMTAREANVKAREASLAENVTRYNKAVRAWKESKPERDAWKAGEADRKAWADGQDERDAWKAGEADRKAWADGQEDRDMWAERLAELKRQQDVLQKQQSDAYNAIQQAAENLASLTDAELRRRAQAAGKIREMSNTLDFPERAAEVAKGSMAVSGERPEGRPSDGGEAYSDDDLLDFANAVAGISQEGRGPSR